LLPTSQALQQYSSALDADPQLMAALNNRALAHLKLQQFAAAEADASAVLQAEPRNVKALLRRGDARWGRITSSAPAGAGEVALQAALC
jgi:RNA polymerase II-associated protein 3